MMGNKASEKWKEERTTKEVTGETFVFSCLCGSLWTLICGNPVTNGGWIGEISLH